MSAELPSLVHETGSVLSGLATTTVFEPAEGPSGLSVSWIEWSSGFRDSGLRIGDRITHVNGEALEPRLAPGLFQGLPGQVGEDAEWAKKGARAGDALHLAVWRPGQVLEIAGVLVPERLYRDAAGQRSLAPGGPAALSNDGFSDTWSRWYERLVWKLTHVLEGSWERAKLDTRRELAELLEHSERIERLRKQFPGDFAERTFADWMQALESLRGAKFDDVDLGYRELGANRLEVARRAAADAWAALHREAAGRLFPAFPAPDLHDRASSAGRWVELPWIAQSGIVNDLGQTWLVADGGSGGAYVARMSESGELRAFYRALFRFGTLVRPGTRERYQFIAEILPLPAMITFRDRPLSAHQVRIVAGRAGDDEEFFVDLRTAEPAFAGESEMTAIGADHLPDDATPEAVLHFMVSAIKRADEVAWRSVFASWQAGLYESGRPRFLPLEVPSSAKWTSAWEAARRSIMTEVYDVRVDRVAAARRLFEADPELGVPAVDQVVAFLHMIGRFDGEFRSFNRFTVTRRRVLQRLGGGPWRLVEVEGL